MNIRKPVDYSSLFEALDALMMSSLPQMELFCGIGKAVSERTEKGAAVAAAEYLQETYPDVSGFSPRNLRRMRDFYRAYENSPAIMSEAMKISWTLNVLIIENCDADEERLWYTRAVLCFGWTKQELQINIAEHAHENLILDTQETQCNADTDTVSVKTQTTINGGHQNIVLLNMSCYGIFKKIQHRVFRQCDQIFEYWRLRRLRPPDGNGRGKPVQHI